jgi:hypothetical protein
MHHQLPGQFLSAPQLRELPTTSDIGVSGIRSFGYISNMATTEEIEESKEFDSWKSWQEAGKAQFSGMRSFLLTSGVRN